MSFYVEFYICWKWPKYHEFSLYLSLHNSETPDLLLECIHGVGCTLILLLIILLACLVTRLWFAVLQLLSCFHKRTLGNCYLIMLIDHPFPILYVLFAVTFVLLLVNTWLC